MARKKTAPARNSLEHKRQAQIKDNEKILQLQCDYLLMRGFNCHKNSQTEKDLIKAMQDCAKRFIYTERDKKGFYIAPDEVEFKSLGAASYIMIQFNTRPDFRLNTPSQYIRLRVLSELYRHKKIEEYIRYTDKEL